MDKCNICNRQVIYGEGFFFRDYPNMPMCKSCFSTYKALNESLDLYTIIKCVDYFEFYFEKNKEHTVVKNIIQGLINVKKQTCMQTYLTNNSYTPLQYKQLTNLAKNDSFQIEFSDISSANLWLINQDCLLIQSVDYDIKNGSYLFSRNKGVKKISIIYGYNEKMKNCKYEICVCEKNNFFISKGFSYYDKLVEYNPQKKITHCKTKLIKRARAKGSDYLTASLKAHASRSLGVGTGYSETEYYYITYVRHVADLQPFMTRGQYIKQLFFN